MKTIEISLLNYQELSPVAKERALNDWNEYNDDPMLPAHLSNLIKEELDARGIKYDTDSINVMYSLGYSRGDGLMFEGTLYPAYGKDRAYVAYIKQSGYYYHEKSRSIEWRNEDESDADEDMKDYADFISVYESVCRKVRDAGYAELEYQRSAEAFEAACDANKYTFEVSEAMRNV